MRCPDCNKFTGLDNGEPECNDIQVEYDADSTTAQITADIRHTRNCSECSQELKALDISFEESVDITETEGYKALSPENKVKLLDALREGTGAVEVEENGMESEEGGGSRYQKNMITVTVNYTLTANNGEAGEDAIEITHTGTLTQENAASDYEEQV